MIRTDSRSVLVVLLSCWVLAACSDSPTEPSGPVLGQSFKLRAGQSLTLRGESVTIAFQTIVSDSRCPIDAICIQAGEATGSFRLEVGRAAPASFELGTLHPRSADANGYRVTLDAMLPAPQSSRPIDPRDYVAELTVTR